MRRCFVQRRETDGEGSGRGPFQVTRLAFYLNELKKITKRDNRFVAGTRNVTARQAY
jgi:hypothetical protein